MESQLRTGQTRRLRPYIIGIVLGMILLIGYVVAYFANLDRGVIYYTKQPKGAAGGRDITRIVPQYRVLQEPSEIMFWPAQATQKWLDPDWLFSKSDIELRDEWWWIDV